MSSTAGLRSFEIYDSTRDIRFPVLVTYPSSEPAASISFGSYVIEAAKDAQITSGTYPLVVISHGSGGSHLVYRTIATHLAQSGFIVAMPEHAGNNRNNNSLEGSTENLEDRPRHVSLVIDTIANDQKFAPHIDSKSVSVIGHSMGGYTALAVAGGQPWVAPGRPVNVSQDKRVKSIVLMAPATGWYMPEDSLKNLNVPVLMLIAEHDPYTPKWQADLVLERVPKKCDVKFEIIENAGHFSFLSPFPEAMKHASFPPSTDPDGFDREAFHERLNRTLCAFLQKTLLR